MKIEKRKKPLMRCRATRLLKIFINQPMQVMRFRLSYENFGCG